MRRISVIIGLFLNFCYQTTEAQSPKEANIWYFGTQAGIDFTNGKPTSLTNGAMTASEGTMSVSDAEGVLLMYSNGGTRPTPGGIWNRNHQLLPNGRLNNTKGCGSSFQNGVVLSLPNTPHIKYMFKTDCVEHNYVGGLSYSIIDMNLDGGLGDVILKDVGLSGPVYESIIAVPHANREDFWIITHIVNSDTFQLHHFNKTGIQGVIHQKVGPVINVNAGEIKVSANGEKLVYAATNSSHLFDFDAATGLITNHINLNTPGYSASFSQNCRFLYVGHYINRFIYQFDMTAQNIAGSRIEIGQTTQMMGSMQLGPDGKIYIAKRNSQHLAVIPTPNLQGMACGFMDNGFFLGGSLSQWGLPNYPSSLVGECLPYDPERYLEPYIPQLMVLNAGITHLNLRWNDPGETKGFVVTRSKNNGDEKRIIETESHEITLQGLDHDSEYEIQLEKIIFKNGLTYQFLHDHDFETITGYTTQARRLVKQIGRTLPIIRMDVQPNPASDQFIIQFDQNLKGDYKVEIVDINGQIFWFGEFNTETEGREIQISCAHWNTGLYIVRFTNQQQQATRKLVVGKTK